MKPARRRLPAAAALAALLTLAACGGDDVVERPAHRPNSVVYVTGDPAGPWKARTEGLADGVKLAIAERDGLVGERAASIAVVPTKQRDGDELSAAIGGERILRDSRTLAVLSAYAADELPLAAPQLNGGELPMLQFGSGMVGLTAPERQGEPERFEPSGERLALRGVPSDDAVAERLKGLSGLRGAEVVTVGSGDGTDAGDDATRLAMRIAAALGGEVVDGEGAAPGSRATVLVTGAASPDDPAAAARSALRGTTGVVALVDAFDRTLPRSLIEDRAARGWIVSRRLADPDTADAKAIRARERESFGRDRGDAVVAGYRAARRLLDLAAASPERTIDRRRYAEALVAAAPQHPYFPTDAGGDSLLGEVVVRSAR